MPVDLRGRHYRGPETKVPIPIPVTPIEEPALDDPPRPLPGIFSAVSTLFAPEAAPATHPPVPPPPPAPSDVDAGFVQWFAPYRGTYPSDIEALVYTAYCAGAGITHKTTERPLTGTPEERTILAALRLFRENVLLSHPEESRTGEWLSLEDTDTLIATLEGKVGG